jgi:hypothetical protein
LTPPSRQIKAALTLCFAACSPEVCLKPENTALPLSHVVLRIISGSSCGRCREGSTPLIGLYSLHRPQPRGMKNP